MRRILCLLLALGCALTLCACSAGEKGDTLSYDLTGEPVSLDPQTASDQASLIVIHNIFEGLFSVNGLGELENALSQSHTVSSDGLLYTFYLREDAKWTGSDSNGDETNEAVTAHDFVFALRRLLRPDTRSPAASQYLCIKNAPEVAAGTLSDAQLGVKAVSDYTLSIELTEPNDNFLSLLASTYAMPCNEAFFTSTRGKYGLEQGSVMTNGPFNLRSWKHGEAVRLARSESYYQSGEVLPTGVNLWISSSDQTAGERLLAESVDAAFLPGEELADLSGKGFNAEPVENGVWGLYLNQKNRSLANENIRKAVVSAFDRSTYQDGLPEHLSVAYALVPHGAAAFGQNFRAYAGDDPASAFDAAKAYEYYKAGLTELGEKSVGGIRLLVNEEEAPGLTRCFQSVSQILQKELSLFISIEALPTKEYNARLKSGDFDVALYQLTAADNTPWSILSRFQSGDSRNVISYQNEELDRLLKTALRQSSQEEVLAACRDAERLILEEAVFIPMYYSTDYFVTRQKTTGIAYNPQTGLVSFRSAALL